MKTPAPPFVGALIGCGFVSRHHIEGWKRIPEANLVALCDLDQTALDRASARLPGARLYTSASALFEGEKTLDFIEICTRPCSHRELVELAARHGAHVLCQKPAAAVRPDLEAMIDASAAAGIRLMVHENWRFRHWYRALRAEIDAGTIGRPIRLRIAHRDTRALRDDGYNDQPYFRTMPRLILLEMGCHLVDTARYLIGEVQTVSATIGRFGPNTIGEDVAMLHLHFAGGCLGQLEMTWCAPADLCRTEWALNETAVEGTLGTLRLLPDGSLERITPTGRRERRAVALPPDDEVYVEGYVATQRHFIEGILNGTEHETRATDTLRTMDVIWTAYRSAEEGRTLAV
ncbi:MAG: Gfo/Idh/MocA family protein [Isosphaeraceae bacterium]